MKLSRKGFTLVEAIIVIVVLGMLLVVLVPSVLTLIDKHDEKLCNSLKDNIISAAKMYVTYNKYDLGFACGGTKNITLQMLVDSGDLSLNEDGKIVNPVTDEEIGLETEVNVTYDCGTKTFSYVVNNISCNQ